MTDNKNDAKRDELNETMNDEIRKMAVPRIFFDEPVTIFLEGREQPLLGRALNISTGGIFIRAMEILPEARIVKLQFALPDGEPITAQASVLRSISSPHEAEPAGMAMRFESLEPGYAERIDQFIFERLQPGTGQTVRLLLGDLGLAIKAKTQASWSNFLCVDAELPFLRLGSEVQIQLPEETAVDRRGSIRWVSVQVPPQTGIPRLNIGIDLSSLSSLKQQQSDGSNEEGEKKNESEETNDPEGERGEAIRDDGAAFFDEEHDTDPVCNCEFSEHSASLDKKARAELRAASSA
jgi:hypothetical protein